MGYLALVWIIVLTSTCLGESFGDPEVRNQDLPSIWIGTVPFCSATPEDCLVFGFDYVRSDPAGDGGFACWTGTQVLCQVRAPSAALPPATAANELRVLSYNVFELPFIARHTGQRERTCRMPYHLLEELPNIDIFVFQEAFMGGCWSSSLSLRQLLSLHGFSYSTKTVGLISDPTNVHLHQSPSSRVLLNGGVFMASRWPIEVEESTVFTDYADVGFDDHLARKGAVYAKIVKVVGEKSRSYHVVGTHMQAGGEGGEGDVVRLRQGGQIAELLANQSIPSHEAVIIAGDFNVDMNDETSIVHQLITETMTAVIPARVGEATSTTTDLDVDEGVSIDEWIDYVTYQSNHLQPRISSITSLGDGFVAEHSFPVCYSYDAIQLPVFIWPNSNLCQQTRDIVHYSDHAPVLGTFIF